MTLKLEGDDKQQIDAAIVTFQKALSGVDGAKIKRSSKTKAKIEAMWSNQPVQLTVEDAEQLQSLICQMAEQSPGPATLALEIIDAAILLR